MDKELLTHDETAEYLRLKSQSLYNLRSKGKGPPFVKFSRKKVLYKKEDLDKYIEDHRND